MPVHIQPQTATTGIQGIFALQGKDLPGQLFTAFIAADEFNLNQQYWLSKDGGTSLESARVENVEFKDYPFDIVEMVTAIDADRTWQQFRLFVGNDTDDAVEVEPDTASSRRWKVLISVG